MSFNPLQPLETISGIDPRIDYDNEHSYLAYRGAKDISYVDYAPTSNTDTSQTSQTTFNLFAPSRETAVDRMMLLSGNAQLIINQTVTAAGGNVGPGPALESDHFGPQAFPMNSCIDNITLQIDNQTINVRHSDIFPLLKQFYFSDEELKYFSSMTPCLLDNEIFFMPGSSQNVLNSNSQTPYSVIPSRGAFPINIGSMLGYRAQVNDGNTGNATQTTLNYTFIEPIMLPPLVLSGLNKTAGFNGVSNIKIQIIWKTPSSCFAQGFSIAQWGQISCEGRLTAAGAYVPPAPTPYLTNASVITYTGTMTFSNLKLCVGYLTLPDIQIPPIISTYDFYNYTYVTKNFNIPAYGVAQTEILSDNIQLPCVPHEIYVALLPVLTSVDTVPVTAAITAAPKDLVGQFKLPLGSFKINVANQTALLSTQPNHLFYRHSIENGLSLISYGNSGDFYTPALKPAGTTVTGTPDSVLLVDPPVGHVYCFKFGKDLQLADSSLAPGVAVNLNFQLRCTPTNYLSATFPSAQLYIIFGFEGVYTISPSKGASLQYFGLLSRQDVLDASSEIDMSELAVPSSYGGTLIAGGSFFGKLKKYGRKAAKFIGKNKEKLHQAVKIAADLGVPFAGDVDRAINMGENLLKGSQSAAQMGASGSGGRLVAPSMGMITGSGMVTAAQMRQRLMK